MSDRNVKATFLDADSMARPLSFAQVSGVEYRPWPATAANEVAARIADADVVIVNKVKLTAAHIAGARRLKLICVAAAGTDNVDLAAAAQHGVCVRNAPDYGSGSVAEHVIAVALALRRQLFTYAQAATDGRWSASRHFCWHGPVIRDLEGSVMGIVGRGRIGEATARKARALGMRVVFASHDDQPGADDALPLDRLLEEADVVSLHVPLTPQTRGMIDRRRLALMKPTALLVNTARGALVVLADVLEALDSGTLAGAAIDVAEVEPPARDDALVAERHPGLLVTPHVAWASEAAQERLGAMVVDAVKAFAEGAREAST